MYVFNILFSDLIAPINLAHLVCRSQQLDSIAQSGTCSNLAEMCESIFLQLETLRLGTQFYDLFHIRSRVEKCANDEQAIKQIQWNPMGGDYISGATVGENLLNAQKREMKAGLTE